MKCFVETQTKHKQKGGKGIMLDEKCKKCIFVNSQAEVCKIREGEKPENGRCAYYRDLEKNDLSEVTKVGSIDREYMEKLMIALQFFSNPFELGRKTRIIIDYDPQKPKIELTCMAAKKEKHKE